MGGRERVDHGEGTKAPRSSIEEQVVLQGPVSPGLNMVPLSRGAPGREAAGSDQAALTAALDGSAPRETFDLQAPAAPPPRFLKNVESEPQNPENQSLPGTETESSSGSRPLPSGRRGAAGLGGRQAGLMPKS